MNREFELRILDVDVNKFREKLVKLGAKKLGSWDMKRFVYHPEFVRKNKGWLRLREDGRHTTFTFKKIIDNSIGGTYELEVEVSDFDKMHELLKLSGIVHTIYQENNRELWEVKGCEVSIDSWPLLSPFVEIEGKNEEEVKFVTRLLGYSLDETTTLDVKSIYKNEGIDLDELKELKFK